MEPEAEGTNAQPDRSTSVNRSNASKNFALQGGAETRGGSDIDQQELKSAAHPAVIGDTTTAVSSSPASNLSVPHTHSQTSVGHPGFQPSAYTDGYSPSESPRRRLDIVIVTPELIALKAAACRSGNWALLAFLSGEPPSYDPQALPPYDTDDPMPVVNSLKPSNALLIRMRGKPVIQVAAPEPWTTTPEAFAMYVRALVQAESIRRSMLFHQADKGRRDGYARVSTRESMEMSDPGDYGAHQYVVPTICWNWGAWWKTRV